MRMSPFGTLMAAKKSAAKKSPVKDSPVATSAKVAKKAKKTAITSREALLADACPLMAAIISVVGPCTMETKPKRAPYESLMRAVAHQQLHGKAAETILRRFCALYPGKKFPTPEDVQSTSLDALRSVGFSSAKALALKDIAEKALSGIVPSSRTIQKLSNEEIVERLTRVRGVGRWTVEMLLMFQLGREDVLPVDDFGLRHGLRVLRQNAGRKKDLPLPAPKELAAYGARWSPHRTMASWYLWRAAERDRAMKQAEKKT